MRRLLQGERVCLTCIRDADFGTIAKWFNDVGFMRTYDMLPALPKNEADVSEMFSRYRQSEESHVFAIRPVGSDEILGVAGFDEIIWTNQTATVFIGIGDDKMRGKGIGKESLQLLLDFGFNELNFYKLQLNVISYNEPAIRLYERAGFIREGTYREFINRDGRRHDMYLYGLLRSEWREV